MVNLGRINIDQNFGLVQRYRTFVRCRQNAFFMECTAPAIILVTPSSDGGMQVSAQRASRDALRAMHASRRALSLAVGRSQAEAFRGGPPPSAEQMYEWVKRSLPDSRARLPGDGAGNRRLDAHVRASATSLAPYP